MIVKICFVKQVIFLVVCDNRFSVLTHKNVRLRRYVKTCVVTFSTTRCHLGQMVSGQICKDRTYPFLFGHYPKNSTVRDVDRLRVGCQDGPLNDVIGSVYNGHIVKRSD